MQFCDMRCKYADWPKEKGLDGSNSCRTFQVLYCSLKDRYILKNEICIEKKIIVDL